MKSRAYKALFIAGSAISVVMLTMFLVSPIGAKTEPSSFTRIFDDYKIMAREQLTELPKGTYYFAGGTKHTIYIGNLDKPFELLIATLPSLRTQYKVMSLAGVDSIKNPRSFRLKVDSPFFFLANGIMPEIFRGTLTSLTAARFLKDSGNYFVEAVPISKSSLILRSMSGATRTYQLGKQTSNDTPYFELKPGILQKQKDGIIDSEGNILFDNENHLITYLYAYRNEFIVTDTNLSIINRWHTIDTFKTAQVKTEIVPSTGEIFVASPPTNINNKGFVLANTLFIQSNLMSKNESLQRFEQGSVVDKYDLRDGHYLGSFYIKNHEDKRFTDFRMVTNESAVVLYHDAIGLFNSRNTRSE